MSPSFSKINQQTYTLQKNKKRLTGTIPAEALTRGTTPLFTHGNRIIQVIKKSHLRPMLKIGAKIPRYHPTLFLKVSYS